MSAMPSVSWETLADAVIRVGQSTVVYFASHRGQTCSLEKLLAAPQNAQTRRIRLDMGSSLCLGRDGSRLIGIHCALYATRA